MNEEEKIIDKIDASELIISGDYVNINFDKKTGYYYWEMRIGGCIEDATKIPKFLDICTGFMKEHKYK